MLPAAEQIPRYSTAELLMTAPPLSKYATAVPKFSVAKNGWPKHRKADGREV